MKRAWWVILVCMWMFGLVGSTWAGLPEFEGKIWLNTGGDSTPNCKGKIVVLYVFSVLERNVDQGPGVIQALFEKYQDDGVLMIGLTKADERAATPYVEGSSIKFPVLLSMTTAFAMSFGEGFPRTRVYDRAHKMMYDAGGDPGGCEGAILEILKKEGNEAYKALSGKIRDGEKLYEKGDYEGASISLKECWRRMRYSDNAYEIQGKMEKCGEALLENFEAKIAAADPKAGASGLISRAQDLARQFKGMSCEEGFNNYAKRLNAVVSFKVAEALPGMQMALAAKAYEKGGLVQAYKAYSNFALDSDMSYRVEAYPHVAPIRAKVCAEVVEIASDYGTLADKQAKEKMAELVEKWANTDMPGWIGKWKEAALKGDTQPEVENADYAAKLPVILDRDIWESNDPANFVEQGDSLLESAKPSMKSKPGDQGYRENVMDATKLVFAALRKYEKAVANASTDTIDRIALNKLRETRELARECLNALGK